MIDRRTFLCGLTLGAPLASMDLPGPRQKSTPPARPGELGYIEGQSIAVEYRFASGQIERYPGLAAELVRLKVDVIVADHHTDAALAGDSGHRIARARPTWPTPPCRRGIRRLLDALIRPLWVLRTWLDSCPGIGHVAVGMHRQGYDLQLTQYDERGWRATFHTTGMEHSPTSATGVASDYRC